MRLASEKTGLPIPPRSPRVAFEPILGARCVPTHGGVASFGQIPFHKFCSWGNENTTVILGKHLLGQECFCSSSAKHEKPSFNAPTLPSGVSRLALRFPGSGLMRCWHKSSFTR
jgi:hypothetical protein